MMARFIRYQKLPPGRRQPVYITVLKLLFLVTLMSLVLQPYIFNPLSSAFVRIFSISWPHMTRPSIPKHLLTLVTVENATRIVNEDVESFRTQSRQKIPKILHQIYANDNIPDVYVPLIRSWVEHHPDHEYWLWDDVSGRKLVEKYYPKFLPLFDAYCHDLYRSDALRYFILHRYGGIYMDMDYECFKSISPLLKDHQCLLVQENAPQSRMLYKVPDMVMNAWMASVPGHPYMKYVINMLPSHANCELTDVLKSTGPLLIYEVRKRYINVTRCNSDEACYVHVLPSTLMMPIWDISAVPIFKTNCRKKRLTKVQQEACKVFSRYHFKNVPNITEEVYASHKFLHIGNLAQKYKTNKRVNITDIVPGVIHPQDGKI